MTETQKKKYSKSVQLLPEEIQNMKDTHDDLLEGLVMPIIVERATHVKIMIDEKNEKEGEENEPEKQGEEKEQEETEDEHDYETKRTTEVEDDTPKEDFFDAKEDESEQQFGDIGGMVETAEDDDNGEYEIRARRLSTYVQNFGSQIEGDLKASSVRIDVETGSGIYEEDTTVYDETIKEESDVKLTGILSEEARVTSSAAVVIKPSDEGDKSGRINRESTTGEAYKEPPPLRDRKRSSIRPSICYDVNRRVESESDIMEFFDFDQPYRFVLPDDYDNEVEEEHVELEAEEELKPLDRAPYYEKYEELSEKIAAHKIKNNILQKKVTMYLKRRKVKYFLKESTFHLDQLMKYQQKLDMYEHILEVSDVQQKTVSEELEILKKNTVQQSARCERLFRSMQTRERNVGCGLIFTKTGGTINEKLIEKMLKRQVVQMQQGMVQEKLDAIEKRDKLENNLCLGDFEQLKVENRNYADKNEEREEELTRLRSKCQNTIQILAHMREKTKALETDINYLHEELDYTEEFADLHRGKLVILKRHRDKYRKIIGEIQIESGLLIYPDLLRDLDVSKNEILKVEEELESCKEDVRAKSTQVRNLRKNIEKHTEMLNKRRRLRGKLSWMNLTAPSTPMRKSNKSNRILKELPIIYSRRPTLQLPIIHPGAFNDVLKIRPNPITSTRSRR